MDKLPGQASRRKPAAIEVLHLIKQLAPNQRSPHVIAHGHIVDVPTGRQRTVFSPPGAQEYAPSRVTCPQQFLTFGIHVLEV